MAKNDNPNTPKPGSSTLYRDPGLTIRSAQSQTVGSRTAMGGKSGTVEEMRKAAGDTSRFRKVWKES